MFCLSSKVDSVLNESISVSNAESQLALPLRMTTVFGASMISSPNGSAVWTGAAEGGAAGVSAAAGGVAGGVAGGADGVAAGLAAGAGAGVAAAAGFDGALAAGAAAGGDCASAWPRPSEIAAAGTSAIMARRNERKQF